MSSEMLNFRVKTEFVGALDRAAKTAGMSRSDFIRHALQSAVVKWGETAEAYPGPVGKPRKKAAEVLPQKSRCPHPKEVKVKLPSGVFVCQACGARLKN